MYWVDVQDIVRCEADNTYTYFFLQDGKKLLLSGNMGYYEKQLKPYQLFFRTERSNIINTDYLDQMIMEDGLTFVLLKNGKRIPLARRRRKAFKGFLQGKRG